MRWAIYDRVQSFVSQPPLVLTVVPLNLIRRAVGDPNTSKVVKRLEFYTWHNLKQFFFSPQHVKLWSNISALSIKCSVLSSSKEENNFVIFFLNVILCVQEEKKKSPVDAIGSVPPFHHLSALLLKKKKKIRLLLLV